MMHLLHGININGTVNFTLDLLGRMTNLHDAENQNTVYAYDAASQLIAMTYPELNGNTVDNWYETYTYDEAGQLLTQTAQDPTRTPSKTIAHTYAYDHQGNITNETGAGAGTGTGANGQKGFDLNHEYDVLNRLIKTDDNLHNDGFQRYDYDSLGNLVYEKNGNGNNKGNEYWYNELNQQVKKVVDNSNNTFYTYEYDKRGNLIEGLYHRLGNPSEQIVEQYIYDATNRMIKGVNEKGGESH